MSLHQTAVSTNTVDCATTEPTETGSETVLLNLSSKNKQSLLKRASEFALKRQVEAEAVLNRLAELNPELANKFGPKEIALSNLTLRLLVSKDAAIVVNPGAEIPSFMAISYSWHNPTWTPALAAQSTTPWGLSEPIVSHIMKLRESNDEGVWIDQLCINQGNKEEKRIAIGSMDVIYRAARRLIIILEDVEIGVDEQRVALKYASLYETLCQIIRGTKPSNDEKKRLTRENFKLDPQDCKAIKGFLLRMFSARWFSRAWCAHECKVHPHEAKNNPLFLCFSSDGSVLHFEFRFVHLFAIHACFHMPGVPQEGLTVPGDLTSGTPLYQGTARIIELFPS